MKKIGVMMSRKMNGKGKTTMAAFDGWNRCVSEHMLFQKISRNASKKYSAKRN